MRPGAPPLRSWGLFTPRRGITQGGIIKDPDPIYVQWSQGSTHSIPSPHTYVYHYSLLYTPPDFSGISRERLSEDPR